MVACYKLVLMEERTAHAATIGYGYAILKLSYAAFVADESIHTIVECCG